MILFDNFQNQDGLILSSAKLGGEKVVVKEEEVVKPK